MIELHAHLGSLTTPRNLWRIMNRIGINIGVKNYRDFEDLIYNVPKHDYERYLKKFELTHKIQSNPSAIEDCVYHSIEDAYIDHSLDGIEIRFNPMLRNSGGNFNLDDTILHACMGLHKAIHAYPIKAGIIISTDKSFSDKQHRILLDKAVKYKTLGVVGIDCSGNSVSLDDIKRLIPMYKECGDILKKTVHAGETYGMIDEIDIAISELGVDRIGHGVQAHRDGRLMDLIKNTDTCLELCPISNLTTGIFDSKEHFLQAFINLSSYGVPMTFNTDGTIFLNTDLKSQFLLMDGIDHNTELTRIYETVKNNSFKYTFL